VSSSTWISPLGQSVDVALTGGKAVNLTRLINAGFPVPGGFVVTTHAFRVARDPAQLQAIREEVAKAYEALGSCLVAVRSSATAEDLADASMAGQYDTFLNIQGEAALWSAIERCWAGIENPRLLAYLEENKIPKESIGMAVVVQRLVPAESAGVLFTTDPNSQSDDLLVESSWGLGESVVSGNVQPDIFRIDSTSGVVQEVRIGEKKSQLSAGKHEKQSVDSARRDIPSLNASQIHELWKLGLRAARHFESPQDIEWAFADGKLYFLQSRPITTLEGMKASRAVLDNARSTMRARLEVEPSASWVVHNMAETLPHPTPLTWSVLQPFMVGAGGFGNLYRQAGFEPSAKIAETGFLELIAGRIYMDLSLAPEMFSADFPFAYDPEKVSADPDAGQLPPTVPKGSFTERMRAARLLNKVAAQLDALVPVLDRELREKDFPEFAAWVEAQKAIDLRATDTTEWSNLWDLRVRHVLDEFAPRSLLPGLVLAHVRHQLSTLLDEEIHDQDAQTLVNELAVGAAPDQTTLFNQRLLELNNGERTLEEWMTEFGHRATGEFDLSAPRWRESPDAVRALGEHLRGGPAPLDLLNKRSTAAKSAAASIRERLPIKRRKEFDDLLAALTRYVPFREDGKHHLMIGYDLLRDQMLEAARRLDIDAESIFLLTLPEVRKALETGIAPLHLIHERQLERNAEARLQLPLWIGRDEIEHLGEPPEITSESLIKALPIASGAASGPARIVRSPDEAGPPGSGYVLVCPSTDPAWTPLFVHATALVLERGGTLSHGAVVAREMGLPAVVLPGAVSLLREGENLTVDGNRGYLSRVDEEKSDAKNESDVDADSVSILPAHRPPPPGPQERKGTTLRNAGLVIWTVFLLAFFILPAPWVHDPSMRLLDLVLWPLIANFGYAGGTAALAALLGCFLIVLQRLLTDTRRLREAKTRSASLAREAQSLPEDSPRRKALNAAVKSANSRIAASAFVPLGLFLGPLVIIFSWLMLRVDPATWSPPPGSPVTLQAMLDSSWREPVTANVSPGLVLSDAIPHTQTLPRIRETLEGLRSQWRQPTDLSEHSWDVRAAAIQTRRAMVADLDAYLAAGVPPETLTWLISSDPESSGRFEASVEAGPHSLSIPIVFGRSAPPTLTQVTGSRNAVISELNVTYPPRAPGTKFWAPLGFNIGWLWVYLLAYTPAMFLSKWLLKVP
jgi:phosphohistidine swiveling domain-containing protein/uncharacterized membrane protein (DUF106 family)